MRPEFSRPLPRSSVSNSIVAILRPMMIGICDKSLRTKLRSRTFGRMLNIGLLTSRPSLTPTLAGVLYVVSIAAWTTDLRVRSTVIVQISFRGCRCRPLARNHSHRVQPKLRRAGVEDRRDGRDVVLRARQPGVGRRVQDGHVACAADARRRGADAGEGLADIAGERVRAQGCTSSALASLVAKACPAWTGRCPRCSSA